LIAVVAAAAPLLGEAGDDELQVHRRLLDRWKSDPDHYARLQRDYKAFVALDAPQRDRLRKLDLDLHEQDSVTQARLGRVLERYVSWLEKQSDADRRRIEAAVGSSEKVQIIKELRENEWIRRLARVDQERIKQATSPEERDETVSVIRQEERQRHRDLRVAVNRPPEPPVVPVVAPQPPAQAPPSQVPPAKPASPPAPKRPQPVRLAEFPAEVRDFYSHSLQYLLSEGEKDRLAAAEGQWPTYARTFRELADKHPVTMPPGKKTGPRTRMELPAEWKAYYALPGGNAKKPLERPYPHVLNKSEREELSKVMGQWPAYALMLHAAVARHKDRKMPADQLGPCKPEDFQPEVQKFLAGDLAKKLNDREQKRLKDAEGKWPDYPNLVMELARKHDLRVPGTYLPGPAGLWDDVQALLPEIPDKVLDEHARTLSKDERDQLTATAANDPDGTRQRLTESYFQKNPARLQQILLDDQKKRQNRAQMLGVGK
jgi:hypothetical protein